MIARGLAGGIAGNLWNAVLMLAVTPFLVRGLGIEAYGLVSLIAVLQVALGALDLGLASTVTREVARAREADGDGGVRLVGSLGTVYWLMAAVVGLALFLSAESVQSLLAPAKGIPREEVTQAVELIAIHLALRWPVAYYAGILAGRQRLGMLNALKSGSLTLRWLGGAVLVVFAPHLTGLLLWFISTALVELVAMAVAARCALPALPFGFVIDRSAIAKVWRFSGTMYAISLIAVLLTQIDRLVVGSFLGLEELGHYSIAYSLAAGTTLLQTALNAAALPAFASSSEESGRAALLRRYHKFSQITGWLMAPVAAALILFGDAVVTLWIDATTAAQAALPVALLAAGFLLNALYSNAYLLGVACGHPGFFLRANVAGLFVYLAILGGGIAAFGIAGAALGWLGLNVYYLLVIAPLAHQRFRLGGAIPWLTRNCGTFAVAALGAFGLSSVLTADLPVLWKAMWGLLLGTLFYLPASYRCLEPAVRSDIAAVLARTRRKASA